MSDPTKETNDAQVRTFGISMNLNKLMKTTPLPKSRNYKKVQPRLLAQTSKDDLLGKKHQLEEIKAQRELEGCTFQPKLNNNSLAMARNNPKPPIGSRDVPDRYKRALIEEKYNNLKTQRLEAETATLQIPDCSGKKPDGDFYGGKVAWRKAADEKVCQIRQEREQQELNTFIGKPTLNDYTKNKIVPADKLDNDEFLVRVDKGIQKHKELIKKIEHKMYDFPYKPALYKPRRTGEINVEQ